MSLMDAKRDDVIKPVAVVSAVLALLSVTVAVVLQFFADEDLRKGVGYVFVGMWVLGPPIWFFYEWVVLCRDLKDKEERDRIKHIHELARNIWIALVVVLVALFGIDWKT